MANTEHATVGHLVGQRRYGEVAKTTSQRQPTGKRLGLRLRIRDLQYKDFGSTVFEREHEHRAVAEARTVRGGPHTAHARAGGFRVGW